MLVSKFNSIAKKIEIPPIDDDLVAPFSIDNRLSADFESGEANMIGVTADNGKFYLFAHKEIINSPAHEPTDFNEFTVNFDQEIGPIIFKKGNYPKIELEDGNILYKIDYVKNE